MTSERPQGMKASYSLEVVGPTSPIVSPHFRIQKAVLLWFLTAIAALLLSAGTRTSDTVDVDSRAGLVAACREEARQGHVGGASFERRMHTARMIAICNKWLAASTSNPDDLLQLCLLEARRGPLSNRLRSWNQAHIYRQFKVCRRLADAAGRVRQ